VDLSPEAGGDNWVSSAFADDALSSVAYTIQSAVEAKSQPAAWAARRAYEAADQAAIVLLGIKPGSPLAEAKIASHSIVQTELDRQDRDLRRLRTGLLRDVYRLSLDEEIISNDEYIEVLERALT
jgi:hypothetical protein